MWNYVVWLHYNLCSCWRWGRVTFRHLKWSCCCCLLFYCDPSCKLSTCLSPFNDVYISPGAAFPSQIFILSVNWSFSSCPTSLPNLHVHFPTCNYLYLRHLPSVGGSGCVINVSLPQVLGFASASLLHALSDLGFRKYFSSNVSVHHNHGGDLGALLLELQPPLLQGKGLSNFKR